MVTEMRDGRTRAGQPWWRLTPLLRFARRYPAAGVGAGVLVGWILVALTIPAWSPHDPYAQELANKLAAPSAEHLLGTDMLGRDILARVLYGARASLPTATVVLAVALLIGGTFGLTAGLAGGKVDDLMMRIADVVMAFPSIILALSIASALGPSLEHAVLAMVAVTWPEYARLMRGQVLSVKELPHVEAARAIGANSVRIARLHVLPECTSPVLVKASLDFGGVILLTAGLSFLGLGAVPPTAEWGLMVSDGRQAFGQWWVGAFPALAITSVVLSANFLNDAMRDVMDPRNRRD